MRRGLIALLAVTSGIGLSSVSAQDAKTQSAQAPAHWGVIDKYRADCHNAEDWASGLAFDTLSAEQIPADAKSWEVTIRKVRGRFMPPLSTPQITARVPEVL